MVRMPSAQYSRQRDAVAAGQVEAGAPRVLGADLEAGGVDDAVDLVLACRPTTTPVSVIRSTPLPSVSTRCVPGTLKACRYSSWKHGRLHSWRYQALSFWAVVGILDDGVDPGADLLHLLEVGVLEGRQHRLRA